MFSKRVIPINHFKVTYACKEMLISFKNIFQRKTLNLDISYLPTIDSELLSVRTSPDNPAFHKTALK